MNYLLWTIFCAPFAVQVLLKVYGHDYKHFTQIKNKYFIMYLFNFHRSFLHLLNYLQQYLLRLSIHLGADILQ